MSDISARAVIFDLDGTLIDTAAKATVHLNYMLKQRGRPETEKSHVSKLVSLGVETMIGKTLGSSAQSLAGDLTEFRRLYRMLPPDAHDLYPYAREAVQALVGGAGQHYQIGVCTNKREDLARDLIRGVGLEPYVQALVGAREGLPIKPDPAPVYELLGQLGVSPAETVYVGDSEVDADTARAAGLAAFVLVSFGYPIGNLGEIDCDARIDDFRALPAVLGTVFSPSYSPPVRPAFDVNAGRALEHALPGSPVGGPGK